MRSPPRGRWPGKTGRAIRLTRLAGFLGSGKTTWLRHQLQHGLFDSARVIVNEAAAVPVDDALLAVVGVEVIAGG